MKQGFAWSLSGTLLQLLSGGRGAGAEPRPKLPEQKSNEAVSPCTIPIRSVRAFCPPASLDRHDAFTRGGKDVNRIVE